MYRKKLGTVLVLTLVVIIVASGVTACKSTTTPATTSVTTPPTSSVTPGGPGGGAVINSDSIVTAKIQAIRSHASGYPWELDALIENSVDVGPLPNPTKDSVGKVITVKTDQDMTPYKVDDVVTAKVKYAGDVPSPGIVLYMYDIALEIHP